jgi:hypothetical protein
MKISPLTDRRYRGHRTLEPDLESLKTGFDFRLQLPFQAIVGPTDPVWKSGFQFQT